MDKNALDEMQSLSYRLGDILIKSFAKKEFIKMCFEIHKLKKEFETRN